MKAAGLRAPLLLSAPAVALYAVFLIAPLALTALLSVNSFDFYKGIIPGVSARNYAEIVLDPFFHEVFGRTYLVALLVTAIAVVLGTPEAYVIHRMRPAWRGLVLLAVIGPLLVSVVVRTFGWMVLLGNNGLVNKALLALGLVASPVSMMFTTGAMVVGLVHVLVPFVVLAVWTSLTQLDPAIERAAISLGASRTTVFLRIVLPNVLPGILSGSLIVFCLAASAFATPAMLGGKRLKVVATTTYNEFLNTLNWPLGAALAVLLLAANVVAVLAWGRLVERRGTGLPA